MPASPQRVVEREAVDPKLTRIFRNLCFSRVFLGPCKLKFSMVMKDCISRQTMSLLIRWMQGTTWAGSESFLRA